MHPLAQVLSHLWTVGTITFTDFAEAWYPNVRRRVVRQLRKRGLPTDAATDLAHRVLEKVYRRADGGKNPAKFATAYVAKTARFEVQRHVTGSGRPMLSLDEAIEGANDVTLGETLTGNGPRPGDALAFDDALSAAYRKVGSWSDLACLVLRKHYQCSTEQIGEIVGKGTQNAINKATWRARQDLPTLGHFGGGDGLRALLFEDQLRATEAGESRQQMDVEVIDSDAGQAPTELPIAPRPLPIVDDDGTLRIRVRVSHPDAARTVTAIVHLVRDGETHVHPPVPLHWDTTEGGVWTGFLRVDKGHAAAEVSKLFGKWSDRR